MLCHGPAISAFLCLILALAMASTPLAGEEGDPARSLFLLDVDNDAINNTDGHFTSGINLTWRSAPLYTDDGWLGSLDRQLEHWPGIHLLPQRYLSLGISQFLFTPDDIKRRPPDPDDMPYAGILFARASLSAQNQRHLVAMGLRLGVTGPGSLGEEMQSHSHRIIGANQPQGWDYQLDHEILANIEIQYRGRLHAWSHGSWAGDLIAAAAIQAGTMMGMATLSFNARWGSNLPADFAIYPIFMTDPSIGTAGHAQVRNPWSIYASAAISGNLVTNAVFLDGTTFRDGPSVSYEPYSAEAALGLVLHLRRLRLGAYMVSHSVPWEDPTNARFKSYGRASISYRF